MTCVLTGAIDGEEHIFHSSPTIAASAYVAPSASVIGKVILADHSSVWFGAVLRGDNEIVSIGHNSNVQDGAVLHTDPGFPLNGGDRRFRRSHRSILHGCTVGDGSLIGIQAVVLNAAVIGKSCLVGAGAVITERKVFADGTLILGAPAKVVRELTAEERENMLKIAANYAARGAALPRNRLQPVVQGTDRQYPCRAGIAGANRKYPHASVPHGPQITCRGAQPVNASAYGPSRFSGLSCLSAPSDLNAARVFPLPVYRQRLRLRARPAWMRRLDDVVNDLLARLRHLLRSFRCLFRHGLGAALLTPAAAASLASAETFAPTSDGGSSA